MSDGQATSVPDAGAALRAHAAALTSAVREAAEFQQATAREDDVERVAAGLRERQRNVADRMLECLHAQQEMTERMLEWLTGREAITEELLTRLDALESTVATLAERVGEILEHAPDRPLEAPPTDDAETGVETAASLAPPPTARRRAGGLSATVSALVHARAPRACAVCRRAPPAAKRRDLVASGWIIAGDSGICPECRSTGWGLSGNGGLPFRRRPASAG
jgi:hypothetical protein